jgi:hypothetical protein
MAKVGAYDYYKDLPSWAKGVALVGGLVIVYVAYTQIGKLMANLKSSADQAARQKQLDSEINDKVSLGQMANYPNSQYNNWADAIQTALSGCDYSFSQIVIPISPNVLKSKLLSSDGEKVYGVLENLENDIDFLQLEKAFGVRTLTKSVWCGYFSGDIKDVDLSSAMTKVISSEELSFFNDYLASKGITYKF